MNTGVTESCPTTLNACFKINGETSNLINDTVFLRVWCLCVKLLGLKQENRQSIQSFYQLQMKTIQKLQKMHKMRLI